MSFEFDEAEIKELLETSLELLSVYCFEVVEFSAETERENNEFQDRLRSALRKFNVLTYSQIRETRHGEQLQYTFESVVEHLYTQELSSSDAKLIADKINCPPKLLAGMRWRDLLEKDLLDNRDLLSLFFRIYY